MKLLDTVPRSGREVRQRVDFVGSVEKAREHFLQPQFGISGTARAYLEDDARLSEAEQVADLVARFSRAEIEEKALGRTVGSGIVKPLGSQLRRSLKRATAEQLDGIRAAIEDAIARTYVSTIGLDEANDARVNDGRTPEQIWEFWIPRIYTGYLKNSSGLAKRDLDAIGSFGEIALLERLEEFDLGRKAKGVKVGMIGIGYGTAGAVLRLSQTSMTPDAWVTEPPADQLVTYENLWSIADYLP